MDRPFHQSYPAPGTASVWHDLSAEGQDLRMVRGGSFRSPQDRLTTFTRASTLRDGRSETIGFRCVRDR